jgi:protein tyrosine/serine phosphatase
MKTAKFALIIPIFFLIFSASATATLPNFHEIEEGLYRSGRPNKEALENLIRDYHLKTILSVEDSQSTVDKESQWAKDLHLEFYNLPMSASKDPKDETVNEALSLMAREDLRPFLIHCKHGRDRTGMIVGLYRVENQNWKATDAHAEMLDLGFDTIYYKLDNYFKKRTGLTAQDSVVEPTLPGQFLD